MPTITQRVLGTFCWPECATTDALASKKFYSELFGWTWKESAMGPDMIYYIALIDGQSVGAMYQLDEKAKQTGVPPQWASYVSVANTDEAIEKAKSLGGELLMGPYDVMELGRMAVLRDTVGATFSVWQAKTHHGIDVSGDPGSLGWTQLNATDTGKAKKFYTALFGWKTQEMPSSDGSPYTTWHRGDDDQRGAGGMMAMPPGTGAPSHWLVYWAVGDTRASHAKATALGATTMVPPTDIPGMLTFSVLQDPQGVMFALLTPIMP